MRPRVNGSNLGRGLGRCCGRPLCSLVCGATSRVSPVHGNDGRAKGAEEVGERRVTQTTATVCQTATSSKGLAV